MEEIITKAEELQDNLDSYLEGLAEKGIEREAAKQVWLLLKLAELEINIKKIFDLLKKDQL